MKRAGFTMIELIFVIVILGILAAVALPKFIGVKEQAEVGKCEGLVGTMNRTVGPAIWSSMLMNDQNASVAFAEAKITEQIVIPAECGTAAQYSAAAVGGTGFNPPAIGASTFEVNATAATTSSAPVWTWRKTN
jgi:prepilin-type N-terminal cleavage/methylation domain-containing protein